MKKRFIIPLLLICISMVVSGCGEKHEHVFAEATCNEPAICECGETIGEPLGHDYVAATCQNPETCTRCGDSRGDKIEHIYGPKLIGQASTCEMCGDTIGEPINLTRTKYIGGNWNSDVCKKTFGKNYYGTISVEVFGSGRLEIYDYDNNIILDKEFDSNDNPYYASAGAASLPDGEIYFFVYHLIKPGYSCLIDKDMNIIWSTNKYAKGYVLNNLFMSGDDIVITLKNDSGKLISIDTVTNEVVDNEVNEELISFDGYTTYEVYEEYGVVFVKADEGEHWGYLDMEGNVLKMYKDCTGFNSYGYALVTDDRNKYSVIDYDFNVVGDKVIDGANAYIAHDADKFIVTLPVDRIEIVDIY